MVCSNIQSQSHYTPLKQHNDLLRVQCFTRTISEDGYENLETKNMNLDKMLNPKSLSYECPIAQLLDLRHFKQLLLAYFNEIFKNMFTHEIKTFPDFCEIINPQ
jgi:hypothetical protein